MSDNLSQFQTENASVADLHPHPRNYRVHPDDQLEHLIQSIKEHGLYRNVVVAKDGTILAGHGVVQAVTKMGLETIPVIRLNIAPDSPAALKVLAGDNEIGHLGEVDDRMFTEILKEIRDTDPFGLMGTGYDDMMLANLLFVTRPESEIASIDEAAHWVGMPEYDPSGRPVQIVISFRSQEDRAEFARSIGLKIKKKEAASWTTWYPWRESDDLSSVRFEKTA
jgi:hypothetical protein